MLAGALLQPLFYVIFEITNQDLGHCEPPLGGACYHDSTGHTLRQSSSPTRATLLTGRNHQRVGSGTIAERAVDWDGYTGVIPRTAATLPKVLGAYG
jgi:hypothetical protein